MTRRRGANNCGNGSLSITTHDDMANVWGSRYVETGATYAGVSKLRLDVEIRKLIPGYTLLHVLESGSSANERAITLATEGNIHQCLFASGSYVAGAGYIANLTSSITNKKLSLIRPPNMSTDMARKQVVAFPYHIPHGKLNQQVLEQLEKDCLEALEQKLMVAVMIGQPYRTLLCEFILSGCGAELTDRFLESLSVVLKKFNVVVIADEVMTAGRVGPTVAMTSCLPDKFRACVAYITVGKSIGCGLVLIDCSRPQISAAGTTTEIEPNEAYYKLLCIAQRIELGMIERKRCRVIHELGLENDSNAYWGKGLLIFTSKGRSMTQGNLWNRLLPMLEDGPKTTLKKGCTRNDYNRVSVHDTVTATVKDWLTHMSASYEEQGLSPYTVEIARCLSQCQGEETILYVDTVLRHLDDQAPDLLCKHRASKRRKLGSDFGRCSASHKTLVNRCLQQAVAKSSGVIKATQKTKKRRRCFLVTLF